MNQLADYISGSKVNPTLGCWRVICENVETGEIIEESGTNLITNAGRQDILALLFALSASSVMCALGAGACATPANVTDTGLNYEYIGNATRKPLTNVAGAPLSSSDIVSETWTDPNTGIEYYQRLSVQSVYLAADPNVGPMQEFGVFNTLTLPGTPTGTSGSMLNHYVAESPLPKNNLTQITVIVDFRA